MSCGTNSYKAPEFEKINELNVFDGYKIDIFNLGIVILILYANGNAIKPNKKDITQRLGLNLIVENKI